MRALSTSSSLFPIFVYTSKSYVAAITNNLCIRFSTWEVRCMSWSKSFSLDSTSSAKWNSGSIQIQICWSLDLHIYTCNWFICQTFARANFIVEQCLMFPPGLYKHKKGRKRATRHIHTIFHKYASQTNFLFFVSSGWFLLP